MFHALLASVDEHLLARHRHCQANPPAQSAQTFGLHFACTIVHKDYADR
jgi:hypothetical protein